MLKSLHFEINICVIIVKEQPIEHELMRSEMSSFRHVQLKNLDGRSNY